tara:strand:- start:388 stop:642 length:255 start_codon:yes stop_codon:yes gene_type:complete
MKITKRQLRRIIKEEKAKLQESYEYDPESEVYDILQHLSDAEIKLSDIVSHYDTVDPNNRKAMQMFNLANQIKKIIGILETHAK